MYKILIADDYADNLNLLDDHLRKAGYLTIKVTTGEDAIKLTRTELPDLILLDIMMPEMSGLEVCSILKNDEAMKDIPVIIVTARVTADDTRAGFDAGAFDYIKKPYNKTELLVRVKSALQYREVQKLLVESEKMKLFTATVVTANHKIKQPLTLINLAITALKRELTKGEIDREALLKKIDHISAAVLNISQILDQFNSIERPQIADYLKNIQMVDLDQTAENKNAN